MGLFDKYEEKIEDIVFFIIGLMLLIFFLQF